MANKAPAPQRGIIETLVYKLKWLVFGIAAFAVVADFLLESTGYDHWLYRLKMAAYKSYVSALVESEAKK